MKLLTNGQGDQFDASLEEILHLITQNGYSQVYEDLKEAENSKSL